MKRRFPRRHGAALIITLAMIAMMTFLVVAFFSRSISNLQVETASTGTVRADLLARSACGIVISDFRTEIIAGSTVLGSGTQQPIYVPKTAATSVPSLARLQTAGGIDFTPFVNLVKQSGGAFFASGGDYGSTLKPIIQTVTTVPTDLVSANARTVVNYRWDSPTSVTPLGPMLCVGDLGYSHYYASKLLPHWIMMTRDGVPAVQGAAAIPPAWKNYTADNKDAAIGRFAYNIYNVGGLMDVNVAGYDESPGSVVPLTAVGQKGTSALAKLSVIPGITSDTNAALFAKTWRNAASGSSADNYLAFLGFSNNGGNSLVGNPFFLAGPKTGFLQAAASTTASDNRVLGRQDLIRLAVKTGSPYGLNLTSLPYLTHFSREVNAPSWSPTQNAGGTGGMGGSNGTGTPVPYAYSDNKDNAAVPNRFFPNVRVSPTATWRRLTGELAVPGEPLVKYRFPLSWLAILQNKTPTSSTWDLTDEAIAIVNALDARNKANGGPGLTGTSVNQKAAYMALRAFGLVWDPTDTTPHTPLYPLNLGPHWNYNGSATSTNPGLPVATRIALLGDAGTAPPFTNPTTPAPVSRDNREANFFELLKAGMLSGSLGNASDYESMCVTVGDDSFSDYQVMQIGANIIDQADSDSYPTKIIFGYRFDNPAAIKSVRAPDYGSGNAPAQTTEAKLISGVEDLPYIYTALSTPYRLPAGQKNLNTGLAVPAGDGLQTTQRDTLDAWLQFVLWKPQQKAVSSAAPSKFRILYTGTDTHLTLFGQKDPPYYHFGGVDFKYQDTNPVLLSSGSPTTHDQAPVSEFHRRCG